MRNLTLRHSAKLLTAVALVAGLEGLANDIQISNPTLTGTNIGTGTTNVHFDITWANSWRTSSAPNNWDAAWIFVKYRDANTGLWQHAKLGSDAQHSTPAGSTFATGLLTPGTGYDANTNWGVGAFLYRSADGTGTFSASGAELRWNYGQNGIAYGDIAEVKVFAVEMVYATQGAFAAGSGGSETSAFTLTTINTTSATAAPSGTGGLGGQAGGFPTGQTAPANDSWPNGFNAFYCMKYEVSQQQYVDFLNNLTRTQQNTRTGSNLAVGVTSVTNRYVMSDASTLQFRNGIRCGASIDANAPITFYCDLNGNGTGGEAADGQWIACNYLSWADVAAYLDWSGLRPMTELEYEKACRGPVAPLANEYAWGNGNIRSGNYTGTALGEITEGVSDPETGANGNALYSSARITPNGPGRVGLFSGAGTDRVNAGASYYGAMDLSGNMWEQSVQASFDGRWYTGVLGNGHLDAAGNANAANWPGSFAQGAGLRGGGWLFEASFLRVSDRNNAALGTSSREIFNGGRGVRQFP